MTTYQTLYRGPHCLDGCWSWWSPAAAARPFWSRASRIQSLRPSRRHTARVPRELDMVSLPPYVIEPPDILMINAVKVDSEAAAHHRGRSTAC